MDPTSDEIVREFPRLFRVYKDGRIERFLGLETTPPGTDPQTAVISKDVTVNSQTGVSLRLYLPPNAASSSHKLPLLIYIHGGAFCVCAPFNPAYHRHLNAVAAQANVVIASVHYRLAPEHPLPICYDDTWEAIQWTSSHATGNGPEPWLNDHADLGVVFLAGDSAGANIAHNMAMRGTAEGFGDLKLEGMVLIHPYFGNEKKDELVEYLYPTYGGPDDPKIHVTKDPNFSGLKCPRVLVFLSEKDFLRDRGASYYEALKNSGWKGVVEMVDFEGEEHVFHLFDPTKEKSVALVTRFISFMKQIEVDVRG
ncbi:2-hydroxyisoflavanone dehydratase-like [Abrus precatorius]|uniref:2-hydroxyisoflavanone dehydratase-like n=1 Tax=Abrus precatorius TaxID=3816 RepID=A0A8B8KYL6_ABRPR|nr:2-hydroxyisoflavanone dehydratase-like [Abrus precatorius]